MSERGGDKLLHAFCVALTELELAVMTHALKPSVAGRDPERERLAAGVSEAESKVLDMLTEFAATHVRCVICGHQVGEVCHVCFTRTERAEADIDAGRGTSVTDFFKAGRPSVPEGWREVKPGWIEPPCGNCWRCLEGVTTDGCLPVTSTRMILCPECGNKRCPKATDHHLTCTGSNESGQPGSVFGVAGIWFGPRKPGTGFVRVHEGEIEWTGACEACGKPAVGRTLDDVHLCQRHAPAPAPVAQEPTRKQEAYDRFQRWSAEHPEPGHIYTGRASVAAPDGELWWDQWQNLLAIFLARHIDKARGFDTDTASAHAELSAHVRALLTTGTPAVQEALERALPYLPGTVVVATVGRCEACGDITASLAYRFCPDCAVEHVSRFARRAIEGRNG
jgi:hypothetical protein